jgi:hypothetical protein
VQPRRRSRNVRRPETARLTPSAHDPGTRSPREPPYRPDSDRTSRSPEVSQLGRPLCTATREGVDQYNRRLWTAAAIIDEERTRRAVDVRLGHRRSGLLGCARRRCDHGEQHEDSPHWPIRLWTDWSCSVAHRRARHFGARLGSCVPPSERVAPSPHRDREGYLV